MALPLPAQDADLVILARRGRDDAFGALYERYFPGVYDFLTRLLRDRQEAADVTQDTFVKAFERLGHLQNPESFKSWLFTIAHRNGLNRIERSKRAVAVGDFYVGERETSELGVVDVDRSGDPERAAEAQAAARIIWEAAAGLDPRTYSVMDLHVRQGLDSAEIADVLGVSKGNAYTMVSRMKKSFSETLSTYLLVRKGSSDCEELAGIIAAESGRGLTPELRKSVDRHAKSCEICSENRKALFIPIKMFAALAAAPVPAGIKAAIWGSVQTAAVGTTALAATKGSAEGAAAASQPIGAGAGASATSSSAAGAAAGSGVGTAIKWAQSNIAGLAAAAVIIALLFVGGAALLNNRSDPGDTEVLSGSALSSTTEGTVATTNPAESTTSATTEPPETTQAPTTTATTVAPSTTAPLTPVSTTVTPTSPPTTTSPPPPTTTLPPIPKLVVRADSAELDEDTRVLVDVLANDSNVAPGAAPTVATEPTHGSAIVSGNRIAYTPDPDYAGQDRLAYSVRGRDGSTRSAQVSLSIAGVNDTPLVPGPTGLGVDEDSVVRFEPLDGATDVDGDVLEMTAHDPVSENGGTVTPGSLIYRPAPNWNGTDRFSYTVSDGTVDVVVTVTIDVAPVNDVPSGPEPVIATVEDTTVTANVLDGWSDVDGDRVLIANPGTRATAEGGTVTIGVRGATTYTPPKDFAGTDRFGIRITDGTVTFGRTVAVDVTAFNDPPDVSDQGFSLPESAAVGQSFGSVVASDPEGGPVTFEALTGSVFTLGSDGALTLTTQLDYESATVHTLSAQAVDSDGAASPFTITLSVTDIDEAPTVAPATWLIPTGSPAATVVGTVNASDPEGAPLTYRMLGGDGVLTIDSSTGVVTLVKDADPADFPVTVTGLAADPGGNEGGAAITIDLSDVDGPAIDSFSVNVDSFFAPPPEGGVCASPPNSAVYTAVISDPSGVRGADLHWHITVMGFQFTGITTMKPIDGRFEVDFAAPPGMIRDDSETFYAKVVATDNHNNSSESAEIGVTLLPCQQD